MNAIEWIANCFSKDDKATSIYKRGMTKAKKHDHQGAIADYTAALATPSDSLELKSMILFNRGVVYVAAGMAKNGADDLHAVLAMSDAKADVKLAAERKLAKIESRAGRRKSQETRSEPSS